MLKKDRAKPARGLRNSRVEPVPCSSYIASKEDVLSFLSRHEAISLALRPPVGIQVEGLIAKIESLCTDHQVLKIDTGSRF